MPFLLVMVEVIEVKELNPNSTFKQTSVLEKANEVNAVGCNSSPAFLLADGKGRARLGIHF